MEYVSNKARYSRVTRLYWRYPKCSGFYWGNLEMLYSSVEALVAFDTELYG